MRQDEIGLTFVGHATFLIETPQGVRIATDYNDATRPPVTPDVVTMNTVVNQLRTLPPSRLPINA